ncbi:MAG: hypothetical protein RL154_140, partial [Pseudomonadota bacterium]
ATSGNLLAGDLTINGVAIPAANLGTTADLTTAINNMTTKTGVTASINAGGKLELTTGTGYGTIDIATSANGASISGIATQRSQGTHLQTAQNAEFTYNGMNMSRSTNTITDIAQGLTVTLNSANSKDISLSVTQNLDGLSTLATQFTDSYNTMQAQLTALTKYTKGATSQGIFVGTTEVSSIESSITSSFTNSVAVGGKNYSLMDFGFSIDKTGKMTLDSTVFNKKLNDDPSLLEKILRGNKKYTDNTYTANMAGTTTTDTTALNDILINGVSLPVIATSSSNTAIQNAQLFADSINKIKNDTGVTAAVDSSGYLKLTTMYGGKIVLATTTQGAALSGLSSDSSTATAISSSTVAIGSTKEDAGVFSTMKKSFDSLFNDQKTGALDLYDKELTTDVTDYTARQEKTQTSIDDRYTIMQKRFQMYDSMIAKMKQQASTLTQMISAASK